MRHYPEDASDFLPLPPPTIVNIQVRCPSLEKIVDSLLKPPTLRYFLDRALQRMSFADFRNRVIPLLEEYTQAVSSEGAPSMLELCIANQIERDPKQVAILIRQDLHIGIGRNYKFAFMRDHFDLYEVGTFFEFHVNELYSLGSVVDEAYDRYVKREWTGMDEMPYSPALTTLQLRLSGLAFPSSLCALPPASDSTKPEGHATSLLDCTILSWAMRNAFWSIKHVLQRDVDRNHQQIVWTCVSTPHVRTQYHLLTFPGVREGHASRR